MKRIKILGFGNELVSDDAFGFHVIRELQAKSMHAGVEVKYLALCGLSLLDELDGEDVLILVDAFTLGNPPGTLYAYQWREIQELGCNPITGHELGIVEVLQIGHMLYPERMPQEIHLLGVEAAILDRFSLTMTPTVQAALLKVLELVQELVNKAV
jgi:hydrogenase maturation protease